MRVAGDSDSGKGPSPRAPLDRASAERESAPRYPGDDDVDHWRPFASICGDDLRPFVFSSLHVLPPKFAEMVHGSGHANRARNWPRQMDGSGVDDASGRRKWTMQVDGASGGCKWTVAVDGVQTGPEVLCCVILAARGETPD